jgi:hypothetical protein
MKRSRRSIAAGIVGAMAATVIAACTPGTATPSERPPAALTSSGDDGSGGSGGGSGSGSGSDGGGSGSGSGSGSACAGDCSDDTAFVCPSGACNAAGTCACDPANAGTDCPSTGCCDAVIDIDGEPMHDRTGAAVYQCVTPSCVSDGDCGNGEVCLSGATCGQAVCGCRGGEGPDPDEPCCLATDAMGVCCTSGEVSSDGSCACPDPLMVDDGHGCQCPEGMAAGDDGACVCEDPNATYDPGSTSCGCSAGFRADLDPYSGEAECIADGDPPDPCPDPHAAVDPATGDCVCQVGFVLGDTLETVSAQCVPASCGDGVCGSGEDCALCSIDCGSCGDGGGSGGGGDPPLDAGVPVLDAMPYPVDAYAPPIDAYVPPPDAGLPPHDAGLPVLDAGVPPPPADAPPSPPHGCPTAFVTCHTGAAAAADRR